MKINTLLIGYFLLLLSCTKDQPSQTVSSDTTTTTTPHEVRPTFIEDPHSFAKPNEAVVKHLDLDLAVDFSQKVLEGSATLTIENNNATILSLDTKGLEISHVTIGENETPYVLHEAIPHLGNALEVEITPDTKQITIHYNTLPNAEALQWLSPQQTAGKKHPFLFTQSQAILARTWVPCQDSPGIRFTYNARVKVPSNLLAVMSANNPQKKNSSGVYEFEMTKPIPAYLLALSVGDIAFQSVGERTGVYAEPATLQAATYEFAEMEDLLHAAENLYGQYQWGRYDLIVLPPSFPFGGMENPKLTFATPTILAGDRSLVSLVAHELAHSWSGNLVTNATWNDFWLNEGFTVYFELRIMEAVYGKSYADMLALISYQDLQETIKNLNFSEDTRLKLSLEGRNPDEGMTSIAYDKGYFFLKLIEEKVGIKWWDKFLNEYFAKYGFQSISTEQFLAYLKRNLLYKYDGIEGEILIDKWVYGPGLPDNCPKITSERFDKVEEQVQQFQTQGWVAKAQTKDWAYQEWVYFLRKLPENLSNAQMEALNQSFGLTAVGNSEILFEWLMLVVKNEYQPAYYKLNDFLTTVGRRKFVYPLFKEMVQKESLKNLAKTIYQRAKPNYHFITSSSVNRLFGE